jgi:hypothetical protein
VGGCLVGLTSVDMLDVPDFREEESATPSKEMGAAVLGRLAGLVDLGLKVRSVTRSTERSHTFLTINLLTFPRHVQLCSGMAQTN